MAKSRAKPGDVYEIPLRDGSFGYGKCLPYNEVSFLDFCSVVPMENLEPLAVAKGLFRVWVMNYAFSKKSNWRQIGCLGVSQKESKASEFFKQNQISGKLSIYREGDEFAKRYDERPATAAECAGLERAAVWNPEHVVDRLVDHFHGRENKWVKSLALKS